MKIEKISENKLKIMFSSKELEENNISVHSFLSNSKQSQNFFLAILDIANEDLGFNFSTSNLIYDTISFNNKFFIIIVKQILNSYMENCNNEFIYKLDSNTELYAFCNALNKIIPNLNFKSSLYQYKNFYFLKIDFKGLDKKTKEKNIAIISEFKTAINFSKLALTRFEEFSNLLIKDSAIQALI